MNFTHDLPFAKGDAPFFSNLSEIFFRPKSVHDASVSYLAQAFPKGDVYAVVLQGSLVQMIRAVQDVLSFPADRSHSLDAFGEYLSGLHWLHSRHVIVVLELGNDHTDLDQYMIVDAFCLAITALNLERRMRLSVLALI